STSHLIFFYVPRTALPPTLFPYTTLFRSSQIRRSRRSTSGRTSPRSSSRRGTRSRSRSSSRSWASSSSSSWERGSTSGSAADGRSEEHTSELQSQSNLVCRLLLEKKKKKQ